MKLWRFTSRGWLGLDGEERDADKPEEEDGDRHLLSFWGRFFCPERKEKIVLWGKVLHLRREERERERDEWIMGEWFLLSRCFRTSQWLC